MVLLGEEAHVESWFNLFGDSVRLGARFAWYIPYAQKSIWPHPVEHYLQGAQLEAQFALFRDSAKLGAR